MNAKLLACIVVVVAIAHLALFQILDQLRKFGQPRPVPPPEPTFSTTTFRYRNDQGKDVKVIQEFKISTQFADPEILKTLPPPPTRSSSWPH
jgi:hypothetical protein